MHTEMRHMVQGRRRNGGPPLSATIAERAAILRASQLSLRLPDAIVLATAQVLDGELLTYDEKLERVARLHPGTR